MTDVDLINRLRGRNVSESRKVQSSNILSSHDVIQPENKITDEAEKIQRLENEIDVYDEKYTLEYALKDDKLRDSMLVFDQFDIDEEDI